MEQFLPGGSLPVPVLVVLGWVWWTLRWESTAEGVYAAADHVYFLGYLCTIAALCALGLKVWQDWNALEDPRSLGLLGGVALLSTITGLIAMTTLKAHARTLPDASDLGASWNRLAEQLERGQISPATHKLVEDLKEGPKALQELQNTAQNAYKYLVKIVGRVRSLNKALLKTNNRLAKASPHLKQFSEAVAAMNNTLVQLNQVLGGFIELLKKKISENFGGEGPNQ